MTMITPSYLGETIEYSSLHACRSTLEDPTDPRFSRLSARSLPTIRPASGRKRWRPVSLGAQLSSGDLIVADSEGGEVTLPSFRKIIRNARPVFNEDNDNV